MEHNLTEICLKPEELISFIDDCCLCSALLFDNANNLVYSNDVFRQTTGLTQEFLESLSFAGIDFSVLTRSGSIAEAEKQAVVDRILDVLSNGRLRLRSRCHVSEVKDPSGAQVGYLLYLMDIRGKRDLNLLQQFAGSLIRDTNMGILLFDPQFVLVDISDMACQLLGFQRDQILYRSMDDIFASIPPAHRLVQRNIFDGVTLRNHAISWMNNGVRYELLLDTNLLKAGDGSIVGGYVTFKDVTNLRSLEEQVQRSDRLAMIGQIAAGTAHEIRNPLTSIRGFLQVLRNTFEESGMEKELSYADIMLTEINRINELVNEFLLLGKRKKVDYRSVSLSQVWKEILPIIQNEALLHGITVNFNGNPDTPNIVADRELLKQVFLNICKNGIEAMENGGELTICERVDHKAQMIYIDIHDTGHGIPSYVIDKIFDPFFTTKQTGTGLGLSVCQRIIHDMGGRIRVSSKGYGTTFTVCIPIPQG